MKKYFLFIFICLMVLLVGCNDKQQGSKPCIINCDDLIITLGETANLKVTSDIDNPKYNYSVEGDAITVTDGVVTTVKPGTAYIDITAKGYNGNRVVTVIVGEEGIQLKGENKVVITHQIVLEILRFGVDEFENVTWKSSNNDIIRVSKGVVTGMSFGTATITAKQGGFTASVEVEVIRPMITSIEANDTLKLDNNATYNVEYSVLPQYALPDCVITSNNDNIVVNKDNTITTKKLGSSVITLTSVANNEVLKEINVTILENKAPEFKTGTSYVETLAYDYGDKVNILAGIQAIDNADGDITASITYDENKVYAYGTHAIELTITDKAGNSTKFERMVTVTWPYKTKLIGHAGCLKALPNSNEAFLIAARDLHYQALECDLHSTKDGVFVTHHDSYFMDGDTKVVIAQKTYEELLQYDLTESKFTGKIGSFETYLDICKEYGCEAVVELKWSTGIVPSDQSRMPALVKLIKDKGMWENTIFLTSMQECLVWFRNQGYNDIRLQYLVSGGDNKANFDWCRKYNIDISVNVTYGDSISDTYIDKYHLAGLEVSTWTFSGSYSQIQEWINKEVEYVTTDLHEISKLDFDL